ncbi:MAG: UvrB/UvrC motif-containing protein [Elusimicrobia bacterium]|nr:UvrB/UvrC motif-containing protein [Elusimicrobiota bacterium]
MEISWPLPSAGFSIAHIMPRLGEAPQEAKCSACGLKYSKFQQTTLLGCSQCYQSFAPQLAPLIKRIHGSLQHQGKRSPVQPSRTAPKDKKNSIKQLRQELEKAVRDENFELAAQLRDQIRELENAA